IDYSLAASDARLTRQLLTSGGVRAIIFLIAFGLAAMVLRKLVIARLPRLHDSTEEVARPSDLTSQLELSRCDECGAGSRAFNRMMTKITESMHTVMTNAGRVQAAAQSIAAKADTTEREVLAQKDNTDQVASATTEMAASAVQVR